ncbi:Histone deacetylase hda1 [Diatrype stigma]|uniref:Histone deacetylase hda1 n=1 Tax=Diatrype stigma TaxID=117547 RepID=A0AAN9YPR4_9PEZI
MNGQTPLHLAVQNDDWSMTMGLLMAGGDVTLSDAGSMTPSPGSGSLRLLVTPRRTCLFPKWRRCVEAGEIRVTVTCPTTGFDAADGNELGGSFVTPACYAHMTHMLISLATALQALAPALAITP